MPEDIKREPTLLSVTDLADCHTVEQLGRRIAEYTDFFVMQLGKPPKLATINRRFGRRAVKLGSSSRQIVAQLVTEGLVEIFEYNGGTVLLPGEFARMQAADFGDDIIGLRDARNMMFSRAE